MRCPKCGIENDKDAIFCEKCDHRLDMPAKREGPFMPPMHAALIALILGAVSLIFYFMTDVWAAAICAGALGIVLGTYSLRVSRSAAAGWGTVAILAVAATFLSAAGFILGISMLG